MPTEDGTGQDDRERRLAALRDIAAQANQAEAPATSVPRATVLHKAPRRRSLPRPIVIALIVAVIAVAAGGAWLARRGQAARAPVAALSDTGTVNLAKMGLHCPFDPTWSPDGTQIALMVTESDCTNGASSYALAVINARTGKLTTNPPLGRMLSAQGASSPQYIGMFAWTPDSKALVFDINYSPNIIPNAPISHGFAILTVASGALKYYPDPAPLPRLTSANTLIWDTHTGKLAHIIGEVPYASAYTWTADGRPEPSAAGATGAASFWQPGYIVPAMNTNIPQETPIPSNSPLLKPEAFYYISTTPQWSPDGRYVALPLTLGARLPGGTQPHHKQTGQDCPYLLTQACQAAPIASPSAGFAAVMAAAEAGWTQPQTGAATIWNAESVAWRADGQEIATMLPGQDFNGSQSSAKVTIFDTQTGKQIKALSVKIINSGSGSGSTPNFAWSPRGSGLALVDFGDDTLTIWRSA